MDRLAILFGRHRLLLACLVLAYTALCLFGLTRLTLEEDPLKLLRSDRYEFEALDGDFAQLERVGLVVVDGENFLTREGVHAIRQIVGDLAEVEGVAAVFSMLDVRSGRRVGRYLLPLFPSSEAPEDRFDRAQAQAESHPFLIGHFLSQDLKTALLIIEFDVPVVSVAQVKPILRRLETTLAESTAGLDVRARITGTPALNVEIVERMSHDIFKFSAAGAALAMGIAMLMFRRVVAALLVFSGPAVGTVWTMGTLGLIGEPINMLTNVVPVLVLVIGFTDSMHLVLYVRRALARGSSRLEAAQDAIRHLGLACALTSLSTGVGFGSLLVASLHGIQTFGWCCAMGSALSFVAVITVVPLLAATPLGNHIVTADANGPRRALSALGDRVLALILRRPRVVLAGGLALMFTLAAFAIQLEPDHTLATEIPHGSEVYQALEHVDETFGGVMFAYVTVDWPAGQGLGSQELYDTLEEVHGVLGRAPLLTSPLSILNLARSLPGNEHESLAGRAASELRYVPDKMLQRLASPGNRRAVVSVHMPDAGARLLKPVFDEVDRELERVARRHPGYDLELTGASVTVFRNIRLMIEDLWKSLATAACVMFVMIAVGLRSLRYALVSVLPNVFPLLFTGAFIVLSGRYLEMSSVIVFSISLGVAVDDTIHFLVRFKRAKESGADLQSAIRQTFKVVGAALVMTTVALASGNAVVMMSAFPAVQVFGLLASVTVASALIGDLLILPALLACLRWR